MGGAIFLEETTYAIIDRVSAKYCSASKGGFIAIKNPSGDVKITRSKLEYLIGDI